MDSSGKVESIGEAMLFGASVTLKAAACKREIVSMRVVSSTFEVERCHLPDRSP